MVSTNEIVFLMVGMIVFGMTVHAWSLYGGLPEARPSRALMTTFVMANLSCVCAVATAITGPTLLGLTNVFALSSLACVALTTRSWRHPLTTRLVLGCSLAMLGVAIGFEVLLRQGTFPARVMLFSGVSTVLMLWALYEVVQVQRQEKSLQLAFLTAFLITGMIVRLTRMVLVLMQTSQPHTQFQETGLTGILRLAGISMDVLVLSSLLGYSTYVLALRYQKTSEDSQAVRQAHQSLQAALAEKDQMLKALTTSTKSRNMGVLLASLSHELSQPMTTMRLKIEYLLSQPQIPQAQREAFLDELLQDNQRANNIITQLKKFLRHGSSEQHRVALDRVVNEALDILKVELTRLNVTLEGQRSPNVWVQAVEGQMQMVVLNLLKNAIDALQVIPEPRRLRVSLITDGTSTQLNVEDNGLGIPPAQWDRVFDMFYSTKPDGMGLGLWLSRSIMQSQGGTMTVARSHLGGAHFTLSWPQTTATT